MRSFSNGTMKTDGDAIFGMPVKNTARVPLANHPAPHILRSLSPERMYCKYKKLFILSRPCHVGHVGKDRVTQNSCNLSYLIRQRQDNQKTVQLKVFTT